MLYQLHRNIGFLFYVTALAVLMLFLVYAQGFSSVGPVLSSLDLPLIGIAFLYGGLGFYRSIAKQGTTASVIIATIITSVLLALFAFLAFLNFAYPFPAAI